MRWGLLACALLFGLPSGAREAPAAALQGNSGWLVWWAEGQKAARASGKPVFLIFR